MYRMQIDNNLLAQLIYTMEFDSSLVHQGRQKCVHLLLSPHLLPPPQPPHHPPLL